MDLGTGDNSNSCHGNRRIISNIDTYHDGMKI